MPSLPDDDRRALADICELEGFEYAFSEGYTRDIEARNPELKQAADEFRAAHKALSAYVTD